VLHAENFDAKAQSRKEQQELNNTHLSGPGFKIGHRLVIAGFGFHYFLLFFAALRLCVKG